MKWRGGTAFIRFFFFFSYTLFAWRTLAGLVGTDGDLECDKILAAELKQRLGSSQLHEGLERRWPCWGVEGASTAGREERMSSIMPRAGEGSIWPGLCRHTKLNVGVDVGVLVLRWLVARCRADCFLLALLVLPVRKAINCKREL